MAEVHLKSTGTMSNRGRELFQKLNLLCAAETLGDAVDAVSLMSACILLCAQRADGAISREAIVADFVKCMESHMDANTDADWATEIGAA